MLHYAYDVLQYIASPNNNRSGDDNNTTVPIDADTVSI